MHFSFSFFFLCWAVMKTQWKSVCVCVCVLCPCVWQHIQDLDSTAVWQPSLHHPGTISCYYVNFSLLCSSPFPPAVFRKGASGTCQTSDFFAFVPLLILADAYQPLRPLLIVQELAEPWSQISWSSDSWSLVLIPDLFSSGLDSLILDPYPRLPDPDSWSFIPNPIVDIFSSWLHKPWFKSLVLWSKYHILSAWSQIHERRTVLLILNSHPFCLDPEWCLLLLLFLLLALGHWWVQTSRQTWRTASCSTSTYWPLSCKVI